MRTSTNAPAPALFALLTASIPPCIVRRSSGGGAIDDIGGSFLCHCRVRRRDRARGSAARLRPGLSGRANEHARGWRAGYWVSRGGYLVGLVRLALPEV